MPKKKLSAAFGTGLIPVIAVVNKATVPLGFDLDVFIDVAQAYANLVDHYWHCPCKIVKANETPKGAWVIIFYDNADQPGALAYHDLTPDGFPISKVFVKTTLQNGEKVGVSATHELAEMLVDSAINYMAWMADGRTQVALEISDPVEETSFKIRGIDVSNFALPSYFESFRKPKSIQFDYLSLVDRPFKILKGGYLSIFKSGRWSEIFAKGDDDKKRRFKREDRRGHRSEWRRLKHGKSGRRKPSPSRRRKTKRVQGAHRA